MMRKAAELLEAEKNELAKLMTLEMGKTFRSAVDEAVKCAWACRYYAENAEKFLADEVIETTATKSYIRYQPHGHHPGDHAVELSFLAGFSIYRTGPDGGKRRIVETCLECAAMRAEGRGICCCAPVSLQGAFQTLLIGSNKVDGILADPRIAAATLTGSEEAGVKVGAGAASRIKKVVLELGGSDPFIVMPSANRGRSRRHRREGQDVEQRSILHRRQTIYRGRRNCRQV